MRVSTMQLYNASTSNIKNNQDLLAIIQEKITSGSNFVSLSEDPVAANRIVALEKEINDFEMYNANIEETKRRFNTQEVALRDFSNSMIRMRELMVQASSATSDSTDKAIIAEEMDEIISHMADIANTKSTTGEYVFSGTKGQVTPFVIEGGEYVYQGNQTARTIQVSTGSYIEGLEDGYSIFQSGSGELSLNARGSASEAFKGGDIKMDDDFKKYMHQNGVMKMSIDANNKLTITDWVLGTPIKDKHGNPIQDIQLSETTDTVIDVPGGTLDFRGLPAAERPAKANMKYGYRESNILNEMMEVASALKTSLTDAELSEVSEKALNAINRAEDRINFSVAEIGAKSASLDSLVDSNNDYILTAQKSLSKIKDLDYAAAASELSKRQMTLEASYQAFSKIQGLSLFNYIK